jgi:hypothetical protein
MAANALQGSGTIEVRDYLFKRVGLKSHKWPRCPRPKSIASGRRNVIVKRNSATLRVKKITGLLWPTSGYEWPTMPPCGGRTNRPATTRPEIGPRPAYHLQSTGEGGPRK